jgi:hypothetical protein
VKERHKPFYERKLSRDERMQVTYGLYSEHMCDLRLLYERYIQYRCDRYQKKRFQPIYERTP